MRTQFGTILVMAATGVTLPLLADEPLANSGLSPTFRVYSTEDAKYSVSSSAEIDALPPVSIRDGETVTATSCTGVATELESSSLVSVLDMGGIWTLANSGQGTAKIGVAWTVNGDFDIPLASASVYGTYAADSKQTGPNRKVNMSDVPPVAYSGDDWVGDVSKAATLTFVSPSGVETAINLTGTGTTAPSQFKFNKTGRWTVRLAMADSTERTAQINVTGGFEIILR